jgi:hypothetical protein
MGTPPMLMLEDQTGSNHASGSSCGIGKVTTDVLRQAKRRASAALRPPRPAYTTNSSYLILPSMEASAPDGPSIPATPLLFVLSLPARSTRCSFAEHTTVSAPPWVPHSPRAPRALPNPREDSAASREGALDLSSCSEEAVRPDAALSRSCAGCWAEKSWWWLAGREGRES